MMDQKTPLDRKTALGLAILAALVPLAGVGIWAGITIVFSI